MSPFVVRSTAKPGTRTSVAVVILVCLLFEVLVNVGAAAATADSQPSSEDFRRGLYSPKFEVVARHRGDAELSFQQVRDSTPTPMRNPQVNRRFTDNPYVPRLVFGSQMKDLSAEDVVRCPKALILGVRGSGEGPKEFEHQNAGVLVESGQKYKNWRASSGFAPSSLYSKQNYLVGNTKLYRSIFGDTVGKHVRVLRKGLAERRKWQISDIGIWSVGVDDLEFSTENPPQSFYHAPAVAVSSNYAESIDRALRQASGYSIPGTVNEIREGNPSQISNVYYALLLLRYYCPEIQEITLIGYSQGAVIARFMAGLSVVQSLVADQSCRNVMNRYGFARCRHLILIADPLFDGSEGNMQVSMYFESEKIDRKGQRYVSKDWKSVRGIMQACLPKFDRHQNCSNGSVGSVTHSPLDAKFAIQTRCLEKDLVCDPNVSVRDWIQSFVTTQSVGGALAKIVGKMIGTHLAYKKESDETIYGYHCSQLWCS